MPTASLTIAQLRELHKQSRPWWQHRRRRLEFTGATPEQRAEVEATARRVRGEFQHIPGVYHNNRRHRGLLPVLNASFGWQDMTPRAAVAVILASAACRRVFFTRTESQHVRP